jgi:hypothetical protein
MEKGAGVRGEDVPIEKLVALHERKLTKQVSYRRIRASIKAVGLVEPLCVYPENGNYVILDGSLRYRACRDLGLSVVPCLILPTKEAYTPNRMVNHLTAFQANRMIRQSLGTVDMESVVRALGMVPAKQRFNDAFLKQIHPKIIEAMDAKKIHLEFVSSALTFVKPEYQAVVIEEMEKKGDFSVPFGRALILQAPESMRDPKGRSRTPWSRRDLQKKDLALKLEEASRQYDFYADLYRNYVADLIRLSVYVRKLMTRPSIAEYLKSKHQELFDRFQEIIFEAEGKVENTGELVPRHE